MRNFLHPIAITPICIVFILLNTSFAQGSNVEHIPLIHPGILMTGEQLDLMRDRINNGIEPQKSAFDTLKNDSRALKNYKPDPKSFIDRGPNGRPNINYPEAIKDAQACWGQALMWSVTKEEVYAENVMNILEAWGRSLKEIKGADKDLMIGLMGTLLSKLINPNFFDMHPPFQIDGNFGYTSGVCTMLVQSQIKLDSGERVLWLLPALPEAWSTGSIRGLKVRDGAKVDLNWSPESVEAKISAERDGIFQVRCRGNIRPLVLKAGQSKTFKF